MNYLPRNLVLSILTVLFNNHPPNKTKKHKMSFHTSRATYTQINNFLSLKTNYKPFSRQCIHYLKCKINICFKSKLNTRKYMKF